MSIGDIVLNLIKPCYEIFSGARVTKQNKINLSKTKDSKLQQCYFLSEIIDYIEILLQI